MPSRWQTDRQTDRQWEGGERWCSSKWQLMRATPFPPSSYRRYSSALCADQATQEREKMTMKTSSHQFHYPQRYDPVFKKKFYATSSLLSRFFRRAWFFWKSLRLDPCCGCKMHMWFLWWVGLCMYVCMRTSALERLLLQGNSSLNFCNKPPPSICTVSCVITCCWEEGLRFFFAWLCRERNGSSSCTQQILSLCAHQTLNPRCEGM